jgi:poly-gamma-glutamate synthesis protein (capsule biosynthesis protein)
MMAEDVFDHHYERVRFEISRFPRSDMRSAVRYLLKYARKKRSANRALINHFDKEIFRASIEHLCCAHPGNSSSSLKLSLRGDIMWIRKGWKDFLSDEVLAFLRSRDIVLGNLETPISPDHKVIDWMPDLFSYNSPPAMLDQLAQCFTAVSIINNHSLDQGFAGLRDTIRELKAREILSAGACVGSYGREYEVIRKNGCKVALLAYAWGLKSGRQPKAKDSTRLNIINLCDPSATTDYSMVEEHVRRARRERAQLIICSLHWGHEFELYPTHHMLKVARHLVYLGVDVIMGHHPHVLQPFEIIDVNADRPFAFDNIQDETDPKARKAVVIYSLGNFVSAMYARECLESCVFNLDFLNISGRLVLDSVSYIPTYCMKKPYGKFSPKVVAILEELKKHHPSHMKRVFTESCQNITERLGKALVYDPDRSHR